MHDECFNRKWKSFYDLSKICSGEFKQQQKEWLLGGVLVPVICNKYHTFIFADWKVSAQYLNMGHGSWTKQIYIRTQLPDMVNGLSGISHQLS